MISCIYKLNMHEIMVYQLEMQEYMHDIQEIKLIMLDLQHFKLDFLDLVDIYELINPGIKLNLLDLELRY